MPGRGRAMKTRRDARGRSSVRNLESRHALEYRGHGLETRALRERLRRRAKRAGATKNDTVAQDLNGIRLPVRTGEHDGTKSAIHDGAACAYTCCARCAAARFAGSLDAGK